MAPKSTLKVLLPVGDWVEDYEAMVPIQALQMLGIQVDVVSPDRKKGQLVMSCIHDFDRAHIDGATDLSFVNASGISAEKRHMKYQLPTERYGHAILLTKTFDEVNVSEYDGIFLAGGRAPEFLQMDGQIIGWIQQHVQSGKPIGSICHGIQMLAAAGELRGKTVTGHPCCKPQAVASGATWEPTNLMDTVVDGNIITAAEWTGTPGLLATFVKAMGISWTM